MLCACGHENRDSAKFCEECGRSVSQAPPSGPVAVPRDPRVYTPKHLAERILTGRAAIEGERKQVTVLFADIRGSMEIAGQLGPERWHEVLDGFFQLVNEAVHRFEGTVNQYTGDGIMALFGAPIAHEDHAERACYAALHLRDQARAFGDELRKKSKVELAVRMGLNSGEVVVGAIGDDLRMDYTAQGQSVGLAQRVEQLAAPNSACVAESTAALVGDYFDLRDLGQFSIKGVSEPVRVYALEAPRPERARIDVVLARSGARWVGRQAEMAVLDKALEKAVAGQGLVVGVVGEPGVGKTRLCLELTRHAIQQGAAVVATAHCPSHAASVSFLPILELLRSLFGLDPGESFGASRRKIRRHLMSIHRSFTDALPFAYDLLQVGESALPLTEDDRKKQLAVFLRRLVQAQSAAGPALLYVDDAHCIDPQSDAMLGELVDALAWTKTLLLVTFRRGHRPSWVGAPHYQELEVTALPEEHVDELLARLMGEHPSTRALKALIRDRTGGNPFFVEEVVQSLVDRGALRPVASTKKADGDPEDRVPMQLAESIEDLAIPPTVHALLASRLDRLEPRDKQVLQLASVIGRSFSASVLRHVLCDATATHPGWEPMSTAEVGVALEALEKADFVRHHEAESDYAFRHPLTQAVAYGSQLADTRARFHVAVARALQAVHAERLGQCAELVAHHFDAANWKFEAIRWRRRAALRVTNIEIARQRRS